MYMHSLYLCILPQVLACAARKALFPASAEAQKSTRSVNGAALRVKFKLTSLLPASLTEHPSLHPVVGFNLFRI
jgi:hypothetical protein